MSKASRIIVLCEDDSHKMFIRRFLKGWSVDFRNITVLPYPNGQGSGKQYVEDNIEKEVNNCRHRQANTILIVVRDADENTVEEAKVIIDKKLSTPRTDNEKIIYVIPKWHIETWLAYLDGNGEVEFDEIKVSDFKKRYGQIKNKYKYIAKTKASHPFIDGLSAKCKNKEELDSPPDSLQKACVEFDRIRDVL